MYLGSPDHLKFNLSSKYVSQEMRENSQASHIKLYEKYVEIEGAFGTVEIHNAPLRVVLI